MADDISSLPADVKGSMESIKEKAGEADGQFWGNPATEMVQGVAKNMKRLIGEPGKVEEAHGKLGTVRSKMTESHTILSAEMPALAASWTGAGATAYNGHITLVLTSFKSLSDDVYKVIMESMTAMGKMIFDTWAAVVKYVQDCAKALLTIGELDKDAPLKMVMGLLKGLVDAAAGWVTALINYAKGKYEAMATLVGAKTTPAGMDNESGIPMIKALSTGAMDPKWKRDDIRDRWKPGIIPGHGINKVDISSEYLFRVARVLEDGEESKGVVGKWRAAYAAHAPVKGILHLTVFTPLGMDYRARLHDILSTYGWTLVYGSSRLMELAATTRKVAEAYDQVDKESKRDIEDTSGTPGRAR